MARKSLHFFINKFSYKSLLSILFILLITVVVLAKFIFPNQKVSAAWWNEGWGYRVAVSIGNTSGSNLTDFQVPLSIGTSTLINAGKMKSDCSDIRITDTDGKMLTYWLSGCNTTSTQVWPKIPTIPTSGTTVYVYYGNPSATSGKTKVGTSDYPGLSCKSILTAGDSSGDNNYWIDPSNGNSSNKFQAFCDMTNDAGGWMLATQSMIDSEVGVLVTTTKTTGTNNGLIVSNITTASGCGPSSSYKLFLNNIIPWTQIKADYQFTGGNSCWGIFGNTGYGADVNITNFNAGSDTIRNQVKMGGSNGDAFDGVTSRCDNETFNFWHSNQGVGTTRSAQVILRRNNLSSPAGLGTGVGCASPGYGWKYQNIYIRENLMTFVATAASPAPEEISPAPVAHWKFDEGVGTTIYDSSSNQNNGSIISSIWANEDQCISGKCLAFNGSSSYTNVNDPINNSLDFGVGDFTVEFWINYKGPTTINQTLGTIVNKTAGGASSPGFFSGISTYGGNGSNYGIVFSTTNGAWGTGNAEYNGAFSPNTWYHVTGIRSGTTFTIYKNGKNGYSRTISGIGVDVSNTQNFKIGGGSWGYANALIDDVKIFPYARSLIQIKSDYAAGLAHTSSNKGTSANLGTNNQSADFLSNGLVGYWKMDEGIGTTTIDSSGNNKTGTLSNAGWSTGKFGIGTSYNDSNSNINITGFTVGPTVTLSAWIKSSSYENDLPLSLNGDSYSSGPNLYFNGGKINWNTGDGATNSFTTGFTDANWHHYIIVNDAIANNAKLYIDGIYKGTAAYKNSTVTNGQFRIGDFHDGSYCLNGSIDEVRIYNRALSPSEVSSLYNWAPGPLMYWNLEEGSGSIVNDKSGNNYSSNSFNNPIWTAGKYGSGLLFDGNDTVNFTFTQTLPSMTISAWVNPSSYSTWRAIVQTSVTGDRALYLHNSYLQLYSSCDSSVAVPLNKWSYVTVTVDSSNYINYFINGVGAGGCASLTTPRIIEYFHISGQNISDGENWQGKIDDVRIYNYARSAKQITEDMNGGHPIGGSPVGSQLAYYKFDEGYGTSTSNWGNGGIGLSGIFGTGNSAPTWSNDGKFNKSLSFNGTSSNITLPTNIVPVSNIRANGITYSAWIKTNNSSTEQRIFGQQISNGYSDYSSGGLGISSGKAIMVVYDDAGSYKNTSTTTTLQNGKWYHIVGTYNPTDQKIKIYLDGKLEGTPTSITTFSRLETNASNRIGLKDGTSSYPFNGLIDEVKIYSSALTAEEIKIDYNRNATMQMGSLSSGTGNTSPSTAASQEYCVPGDTVSCAPPIAEYKFDEGVNTTAYDTSGNNINASFAGTPTWTQGKIGKALNFSGSAQAISVPDNALLKPTNYITTQAWFNTKNKSLSGQRILSKTEGSGYQLSINENSACPVGTLCFLVNINGLYYSATYPSSNLSDNTWYHVAGTYNGSTVKLFLNGSSIGTTATISNTITQGAYNLCIGSETDSGSCTSGFFNGKIDQVRIYNYARTPAQIAWDYNKGGPIGHWKMDECQGNTVYDWSGNNNNGTIIIGATGSQTTIGTCSDGLSTSTWNNGKTGKYNSSLNFDGTDDYVNMGAPPSLSLTGPVTQTAWIKLNNFTGSKLISGSSDQYNIQISRNSNGDVSVVDGNGHGCITSPNIISSSSSWYQVVGIFSGTSGQAVTTSNCEIYVNGIKQTVSILSSPWSPTTYTSFNIGNWANGSGTTYKVNGQIDDVRVYNYALTSTQIKTLYNNGAVNFSN